MDRRKFHKTCGIDRRGLSLPRGLNALAEAADTAARPDLVVAHGASPEKIVKAAIDAMGGIKTVHLPRRHRGDQTEHRMGPDA